MKKCIKRLFASILLLSLAGIAFALDTGLEMTNAGGWKDTGEGDWFSDHKLIGWIQIPFDNGNVNSVSIEGGAYASKPANSDDLSFFANLDLLRFSLVPLSAQRMKVSLDAGRIPVADVSGFILNQSVDGAEAHGSFVFGNIDFLASYTGLLNVRKDGTLMSSDDYADADTDAVYAPGSSRAVGKISVQFPQLVAKSDLILEATGQYDIRRFLESDPDEVIDTAYGTVLLSGPIRDKLYYSLSGTYQTGILETADESYSEDSLIASLRFDLYPFAGNQMYAQFVYSPPENDFFSLWLPVTFQSAGTLFTGGYGNLMRASAGWNFNPSGYLNFDLGCKVFMYSEVPESADAMYRSTEITGGSTIRATSDLRFRLDGAVLIQYEDDLLYQASLKVIFDL